MAIPRTRQSMINWVRPFLVAANCSAVEVPFDQQLIATRGKTGNISINRALPNWREKINHGQHSSMTDGITLSTAQFVV